MLEKCQGQKCQGHVLSWIQAWGAFLGRKWRSAGPFVKSSWETFQRQEISMKSSSKLELEPFKEGCSHTEGLCIKWSRPTASTRRRQNSKGGMGSLRCQILQGTFGYSTLCWNEREIVTRTFSTGRKSFSTSIDLGLSFIGLSLKISPKPTPLTFFGWIAAVATVPLAPSDLVLLESPPSLSEPVVSLKPVKRGDGERKSSEINHGHEAPHSQPWTTSKSGTGYRKTCAEIFTVCWICCVRVALSFVWSPYPQPLIIRSESKLCRKSHFKADLFVNVTFHFSAGAWLWFKFVLPPSMQ